MGNLLSKTTTSKTADHIDSIRAKVTESRRRFLDRQLSKSDSSSDSSSDEDTIFHEDIPDSNRIFLPGRKQLGSIINIEEKRARGVQPENYDFPFENVVLEGGGNKGLAYCGAVRVLEELGMWKNVKRLAGASAGAMTAALLAVGCDSYEIEQFLSQDLSRIFLDHQCGYLSLLPNLLRGYGWNPGVRIFEWFGRQLKDITGKDDVTFEEVYKMFGKELCVVVTNLNQMNEEYCHPKTTPDMSVSLAVRMSMAIPGMFCAMKVKRHEQVDTFVDGGVLCNYPIHCFDGWWLSMKPEDTLLRRLRPLDQLTRLFSKSERFGTYNEKTLGFLLYADNEQDLLRYHLERRHGVQIYDFPKTKLAKKKIETRELRQRAEREHRRVVHAVDAFTEVLRVHDIDENHGSISRTELLSALSDTEKFPAKMRKTLFGDVDDETIIKYLDRDSNDQISYQELTRFMEEAGIHLQTRFLGYERREVRSFFTFLDTLQSTLLTNVKRVYVEERDLERTVGINTGHVGTSDFKLEEDDRKFVIEQGRKATLTFLQYYVVKKKLKPRSGSASSAQSSATPAVPEEANCVDVQDIHVDDQQPIIQLEG